MENIEKTFALIAERAKIAEEYIQNKVNKEEYYAEMTRLDQELSELTESK